jgi:hypothetical protein
MKVFLLICLWFMCESLFLFFKFFFLFNFFFFLMFINAFLDDLKQWLAVFFLKAIQSLTQLEDGLSL